MPGNLRPSERPRTSSLERCVAMGLRPISCGTMAQDSIRPMRAGYLELSSDCTAPANLLERGLGWPRYDASSRVTAGTSGQRAPRTEARLSILLLVRRLREERL